MEIGLEQFIMILTSNDELAQHLSLKTKRNSIGKTFHSFPSLPTLFSEVEVEVMFNAVVIVFIVNIHGVSTKILI